MAITIDATVGGINSNSFITVAEADALAPIVATSELSVWSAALNDVKSAALVKATDDLSRLAWIGLIASDTQALNWPRTDVWDREGRELPGNVIPAFLKKATARAAMLIIGQGSLFSGGSDLGGLQRLKVDAIELEMPDGETASAQYIHPDIYRYIGQYLIGGPSGGLVMTVDRGGERFPWDY